MSYINISYSTVDELVNNFRKMNISNLNYFPKETLDFNEDNLFVLIYPKKFYGSYGGILKNEEIANVNYPFFSQSVDENFSIVWWLVSSPPKVGTRLIYAEDGRVLIPFRIFSKLKSKHADLSTYGKSSYYKHQCENDYC